METIESILAAIIGFLIVVLPLLAIYHDPDRRRSDLPRDRQRLTNQALSRTAEELEEISEQAAGTKSEETESGWTKFHGWKELPEAIRIALTKPENREVLHRLDREFWTLSEKDMYLEIIRIAGEIKRENRIAWVSETGDPKQMKKHDPGREWEKYKVNKN